MNKNKKRESGKRLNLRSEIVRELTPGQAALIAAGKQYTTTSPICITELTTQLKTEDPVRD